MWKLSLCSVWLKLLAVQKGFSFLSVNLGLKLHLFALGISTGWNLICGWNISLGGF